MSAKPLPEARLLMPRICKCWNVEGIEVNVNVVADPLPVAVAMLSNEPPPPPGPEKIAAILLSNCAYHSPSVSSCFNRCG